MPDNLIQVGAVVDLGQYKAGMQDAVATTERAAQEISASFEKVNVRSSEAMAGMAFAVEDSGIKVSRHFRRMLTEIPLVNAAFETLMPVLAIGVGIEILGHALDKVVELSTAYERLSEDAKKSMDEVGNSIKRVIAQDEKLLAIQHNRELIGKSAVEQAHLRALWAAEEAKAETGATQELLKQYNAAKLVVAAHEQDVSLRLHLMKKKDADPSLVTPSDEELQASLRHIEMLEAAYGKGLSELQDKAAVARAKEGEEEDKAANASINARNRDAKAAEANHTKFVSMVYAERQAMVDKAAAHETGLAQETQAVFRETEKQNQETIKAADKQMAAWDEAYKGQIEAAKSASEIKIQQITQGFERGKITQQQEISLIAKAKRDELRLEVLFHQERQALWAGDLKKIQEIENQISKAVAQSALVGAKATTDGLKITEQKWKSFADGISSSLNSALSGWMQGTETFGQAWAKMADDMSLKFIASLERQLAETIVNAALKDAVDEAYYAKSGLRAAISAAKKSFDWASQFVGPILAAPIAAAAFVAVESFGSYDVGTNYVPMDGLAMLHKGEQVIPASKQGPGYSGGGELHVHTHVTIQTMDSRSFGDSIDRHSHTIEVAVKKALKHFAK